MSVFKSICTVPPSQWTESVAGSPTLAFCFDPCLVFFVAVNIAVGTMEPGQPPEEWDINTDDLFQQHGLLSPTYQRRARLAVHAAYLDPDDHAASPPAADGGAAHLSHPMAARVIPSDPPQDAAYGGAAQISRPTAAHVIASAPQQDAGDGGEAQPSPQPQPLRRSSRPPGRRAQLARRLPTPSIRGSDDDDDNDDDDDDDYDYRASEAEQDDDNDSENSGRGSQKASYKRGPYKQGRNRSASQTGEPAYKRGPYKKRNAAEVKLTMRQEIHQTKLDLQAKEFELRELRQTYDRHRKSTAEQISELRKANARLNAQLNEKQTHIEILQGMLKEKGLPEKHPPATTLKDLQAKIRSVGLDMETLYAAFPGSRVDKSASGKSVEIPLVFSVGAFHQKLSTLCQDAEFLLSVTTAPLDVDDQLAGGGEGAGVAKATARGSQGPGRTEPRGRRRSRSPPPVTRTEPRGRRRSRSPLPVTRKEKRGKQQRRSISSSSSSSIDEEERRKNKKRKSGSGPAECDQKTFESFMRFMAQQNKSSRRNSPPRSPSPSRKDRTTRKSTRKASSPPSASARSSPRLSPSPSRKGGTLRRSTRKASSPPSARGNDNDQEQGDGGGAV